ncbi:oxidoreductase [Streptomyces armeniacus]|uniref:Oxidoreductase n=1 Tax=Streptomyces armeniacus TaxID=83291 RepID=A0A345XTG6_9ACTN|nr:oxidoreductase [Streptomyces armeniacus]AXK34932.1 oxidoreductase [Streptomyces armeniacus]
MLNPDELTPPERALWNAFPVGEHIDLRTGRPEDDALDAGPRRGPARTVRAAVLAALLLGGNEERRGAVPALRLSGARITGHLTLDGAEIRHLLRLEDCWFEEAVSLEGASTLALVLTRCRIPGLLAPAARIEGRLDLRGSLIEQVERRNALRLTHAQIGGGLRLDGATLWAPGDLALSAGGIVMSGAVMCENGFRARGEVALPGAQLPGGLFMRGARLENPEGIIALQADNVTASTIRCSRGFHSEGKIRLRGAQTADLLTFEGATLRDAGNEGRSVLVGIGMRTAELDLRFAEPPQGAVVLRNTHTGWYQDEERSWPAAIRLEGFTYDALRDAEPGAARQDVARRLAWIRRNPRYSPQPYEQLAACYRRIGHDDDARRVLLTRQRDRRRTLRPASRAWGYLLDATVGYGYRPWLAGVWLAALTLLGTLAFRTQEPRPVKPGEGPAFQAFVYTLDLLIPIGGLGQRGAWHWAGGGAQWLAYGLIGVGWLLTTAVLAGVSRTLAKQ